METLDNFETRLFDNAYYIIRNKLDGKCLKLGLTEFDFFCHLLDGNDASTFDRISVENKEILRDKLNQTGFLNAGKTSKKYDLRDIKLFVFCKEGEAEWLFRFLKTFISPLGVILFFLSVIGSVWFLIYYRSLVLNSVAAVNISFTSFFCIIVFNRLGGLAHEFAHSASCYKYTGKTGSVGLKLFYLMPMLYVNTNHMYLIQNKLNKAVVAISGFMCSSIVSAVYAVLYVAFKSDIWLYCFILSFAVNFFNLIPFTKYDGYWLLGAVLGIDNLYDKSIVVFLCFIFRFPEFGKLKMSKIEKTLTSLYGFVCFIFNPVFWGYVVFGSYWYLGNYGIIPALIVPIVLITFLLISNINFCLKYHSIFRSGEYKIVLSNLRHS
ncbi:MAG: hypothetical protein FWH52_00115 [Synergistaceae bacterium]|nr:hypothetical protein [Synergistaceae bacterium]